MRWANSETPTFTGSDGTGITGPDVVEAMTLYDRQGNAVMTLSKGVDGTFSHDLPSLRTAATAAERLALTGLPLGTKVRDDDTDFIFELLVVGGEADSSSWLVTPKRYVALLTQTGTDAPVATVQGTPTIGGDVTYGFDFENDNYYEVLSDGLFPLGKTSIVMGSNFNGSSDGGPLVYTQHVDVNTIRIYSKDSATGSSVFELLTSTAFDIEVYP